MMNTEKVLAICAMLPIFFLFLGLTSSDLESLIENVLLLTAISATTALFCWGLYTLCN